MVSPQTILISMDMFKGPNLTRGGSILRALSNSECGTGRKVENPSSRFCHCSDDS